MSRNIIIFIFFSLNYNETPLVGTAAEIEKTKQWLGVQLFRTVFRTENRRFKKWREN